MKKYDRIFFIFAFLIILMLTAVNVIFSRVQKNGLHREYRVEVNRLADEMERGNEPDISHCSYVVAVTEADDNSSFYNSNYDYVIKNINGQLYRFDYILNDKTDINERIKLNAVMIIFLTLILAVFLYIRNQIIKPFYILSEIPTELAKGNLSVPIEENKNRFFGKFTWGLDMLREKLEDDKKKELDMQKEKQTMLLSISHDIKTPLSAIKLYSKALSKGIYKEEEKKKEAAEGINKNADEIETFVTRLMDNASEDFLRFDVKEGDYYLSKLMDSVTAYYKKKLELNKTEFIVEKYNDCLLYGDLDRSVEVIQNIIENAIKYGDGKRLSISFFDEEDCRLITVSNTGCTLPESEIIHIFDSFWRGSNSEGKSGSGLGLYICRKLMRAMNGDIYAKTTDGNMLVTLVIKKV